MHSHFSNTSCTCFYSGALAQSLRTRVEIKIRPVLEVVSALDFHRDKQFIRQETGRDWKILLDRTQAGGECCSRRD